MINKIYEKTIRFIKNNYLFLITMVIILFLFNYEFPYVIYKSGGIINLADRVIIDKEYQEKGSFSMSYVTAMKGTGSSILLSFLLPDWDLTPLKEVAGDKNYDEIIKLGKIYLNEGIDSAIIAAFKESDYDLVINKEKYWVIYVTEEANTDVVVGDELISVDNNEFDSLEEIREYFKSLKENDIVKLKVKNDDKIIDRYATLYMDKDNSLKMGLVFKKNYEYSTEIPVSIKMKDNESGSSGGLMMSLAIYNALIEEDITKGLKIVGTGTIDSEGNVGEIDGVKYKVLAASKNGADIFFCPLENYEEAIEVKKKRKLNINIVKVKTLKEAIAYLESN